MKPHLYESVDEPRLSGYLSELRNDASYFRKLDIGVGFKLGPVSIDLSRRTATGLNRHKDITDLVRLLDENGALIRRRPSTYEEIYFARNLFVLEEKIAATKFLLPAKHPDIPQLTHLTIWVSMPKNMKPMEKWDANGSVLFLIESFWEDAAYHGMISGCSALQWIIRASHLDNPDLSRDFSRSNRSTPLDKLRALGAIDQGARLISSLYRKRYMSNEQMFEDSELRFRCFDVVGYPIYIEIN